MSEGNPGAGSDPPGPPVRGARGWLALLGVSLAAWVGIGLWVFTLTTMASGSMQPTLRGGGEDRDIVLVDRLTHRLRPPRRGEIVHFQSPEGEWILKRVVGLPGETVEIRGGRIVIDGQPLVGPPEVVRWNYRNDGHLEAGVSLRVEAGFFLVLGDDSQDSYDSRYWGCLEAARIQGLARAVIWPPSRVSGLSPSS